MLAVQTVHGPGIAETVVSEQFSGSGSGIINDGSTRDPSISG